MIITYKNNDEVTERYYKNYYEYLHFSAEENKRLDEINQNFVFMQTYLRDRILQIANIFQKLSKKDFPYLREFRIAGTIESFKIDPRIMSNYQGVLPAEQIQIYEKWNDFRFCNIWQLEYDSNTKDFSPLSKVLLNSAKFDHWRHTTFDLCSYLSFLINQNENVTYKDLLDFDFKNDSFYTEIRVYINYSHDDIFCYVGAEQLRHERKILSERSHFYNNNFYWSQPNIEHFFELDRFCKKKYEFIEKELKKLKHKFQSLKMKNLIDFFCIYSKLHYNSQRETSIANSEIQNMFARQLSTGIEEYLEIDAFNKFRVPLADISLNWNYEEYSQFLSKVQRDYKFNSYMRRDLIDNDIFSFEDILNMTEKDFCVSWQFRFSEPIPFLKQRRTKYGC